MLKKLITLLVFMLSVIFISCSNWLDKGNDAPSSTGNLFVMVLAESINYSSNQTRATTYSRLRLQLLNSAGAVVKDTSINITPANDGILCGFGDIPAETEYRVVAWTTDTDGDIIHSPDTQTVFVEANTNKSVALTLRPRVGSIIVQFALTPTTIDTFFMSFDSDSGFFEAKVARMPNTYIALNKIPYGAEGILAMSAKNRDGTMFFDWDTLFTFRRENIYLELSLMSNDMINLSVIIDNPYNTVFTAITNKDMVLQEEKNIGVLITEFCVNATNSAEFVEVGNLSQEAVSFNELAIAVGGTIRIRAQNVTIEPMETFVFGNTGAPGYWENIDAVGSLSLASTSGFLEIYGDGELLDYVVYFGTSNTNAGWPRITASGRTSWVLKELVANPKHNNFGGNWRLSTNVWLVEENGSTWYGSPGILE